MGCPKLRNPFRKRHSKKQPRKETTDSSDNPSKLSSNALSGTCSILEPVAKPKSQTDALPAEGNQVPSCSDTTLSRRDGKAKRRNLWQEAYDALDEKQRQYINPAKEHEQSSDNDENADTSPVCKTLDGVVQTVKAQYEIRICKEIISAIVAFDPTGHASSVWTVVSLGLTSSAILTDILARYAVIEKLYRDESCELNDKIEDAILRVYISLLRYAAEAMKICRSNTGKRLMHSVVTLANLPLTDVQSSIDTEETHLEKWLRMYQQMQRKQEANNILLGVDRLLDDIRDVAQKIELDKLPIAEGAHFNSHMDEDQVECLENTRVELLDEITDWVDDTQGKTIFWLRGVAGTGKSTISRTVARKLQERELLGASFFFKRGEGDRGNASRFITTIAKQFMIALPQLRKEIATATKDDLIVSKSLKEQFDHLLLKPLLDMEMSNGQRLPVVIVVDALDECEERSIETIIQLLPRVQESKTIYLKVFVTSRPEHPILEGFEQIEGEHKDVALHEIERCTIERDMALFFEDRLSRIRKKRKLEDTWPGEIKTQALVDMAMPLFIFAATVCRLLEDYRWDPDDSLNNILKRQYNNSQLDKTYLPVLDKLTGGQDQQAQSELVKQFQQVVGIIVVLESPLSIASLSNLINMKENLIRIRLDSLHSVLNIPSDNNKPVRMFHLSFREFLLHPATRETTKLSVDGQSTHRDLAYKCIAVMMDPRHGLRQNICGLPGHGTSRDDIGAERIERYFPAELRYATRYWVHHLTQGALNISDQDGVHEFLETHFLHWLEAMSILAHLPETIGSVNMLLSIVQRSHANRISRFLYDAKRFTLKNISIAKEFPLQLYSSALLFAPEKCTIRNTFFHCAPPYFSRLPRVPEYWGAELQTIETGSDWVESLEFSPDGRMFLTLGDSLKLWETSTGDLRIMLVPRTPFGGECAFSPDGKLVATLIRGNILLFDPLIGTLKRTLKVQSGYGIAIAFLSNEELVSASRDGTLEIWSTISGKLQQTASFGNNEGPMSGHLAKTNFSPDGSLLVYTLLGGPTKLWDIEKAERRHILKIHGEEIRSLAFSPDGQLLATGSRHGILELWDLCEGTLQHTLRCYDSGCCIKSIAFSHDGRLLALCCTKGLRIWEISHSPILSTFASRNMSIDQVTFSPDDKLVALVNYNKVMLWDTARLEETHAVEGHTNKVNVVRPSPTGSFLASGSGDTTVRLWDILTGTVQRVLQGHSDAITDVSISPNGHLLAASSEDGLIKIWDVSSGSLQHTLSSDNSRSVKCMLFSPDGNSFLSISRHKTHLWDVVTGLCKWTVEESKHSSKLKATFSLDSRLLSYVDLGRVTLRNTAGGSLHGPLTINFNDVRDVAFSPSGDLLASSHGRDNLVRLWNTSTGRVEHVFTDCSLQELQFSPDGKLFSSGHVWEGVKVWNVTDGTLRQTLEAQKTDRHSWLLDTNRNEYMIHHKAEGYKISFHDDDWIGLGEDKILWLPPEYRPDNDCWTRVGNTVIVGCETGDVIFIGLRSPSED
ncbi:WD40 repeat-like protein [Aspergillus phoenicis ATCC 13157]|uniref:WD40 repeat-like protein n=1 Tax=Aspergillus phoenicis ATCC 13157 TaxID=1353007 RepID=A0A370PY77_ASPPH|nr:WD40 repeat-like protein [Aspergillus phoenicis ATCC 13157]